MVRSCKESTHEIEVVHGILCIKGGIPCTSKHLNLIPVHSTVHSPLRESKSCDTDCGLWCGLGVVQEVI